MAKKGKSNELVIRLVLTTDDYSKSWKAANREASLEGDRLQKAADKAATGAAVKFLTLDRAAKLAAKSVKEIFQTAQRLEKEGRGDAGTAAVSKLAQAFQRAEEALTRWLLSSSTARGAVNSLARGFEAVADALGQVSSGSIKAEEGLRHLFAEVISKIPLLGPLTIGDARDARSLSSSFRPGFGESLGTDEEAEALAARIRARSAFGSAADAARRSIREAGARSPQAIRSDFGAYEQAVQHTIDSFVGSWASGLDHLGGLFDRFSQRIAAAMGGVKEGTVKAFGSVFESIAFTAPLMEQVFGRSEKAAKKFQAAQLAVVGAVAAVKSVLAFADAYDLISENPAGALAKLAASAGYASAAALAGVATSQTLAGARRGVSDNFSEPSNFEKPHRKFVTVVIQNAIGGEAFVRDTLIPEINRAVGEDVFVASSHATSSNRVDPAAAA